MQAVGVLGGVSIDGRTDLHILDRGTVTAQRYRDEVLDPIVKPYAGAVGEGFFSLMHDNAGPHTARICTAYPDQQGVEFIWTGHKVPRDLNPI